jgi:hypothetical protein
MKPSKWPWIIVAVLLVGTVVLTTRTCKADAKYRAAKLEYVGYRAIAEADHKMSLDRIAAFEGEKVALAEEIGKKDAEIAGYVDKISTYRGKLTQSDAESMALRTKVQPVLDANPTMAEFVASLDAGIVLRDNVINEQEKQIATLTAQGILKDQRFAVQVKITDEWRANYDREHALRLAAEDLLKLGERRVGLNKTIRNIALGIAGAGIIYGLTK